MEGATVLQIKWFPKSSTVFLKKGSGMHRVNQILVRKKKGSGMLLQLASF
jgi:hypothetical protein